MEIRLIKLDSKGCLIIFSFEFFVFVLGFLHGLRVEFTDDVSGVVVGPIFTGHESERK